MVRFLSCCSLLAGAMTVGADVLIDDFENAGAKEEAHWTSIGEALNKSDPSKYVSYWYFYDDSVDGGKSHMEPKLLKDAGSAGSFALCQKAGDGVNGSKGFHQTWYLDGNGGKWAYPYLALGFDYLGQNLPVDMTNLTAISLYAKGTAGGKIGFTIETNIAKTSFSGTFTLTNTWTKHKIAPSSFVIAPSGKTWNDAKTKATGSHIQMNGKSGDIVEFWLDSLVFEGMSIDAFLKASPVKHPAPKTGAAGRGFTISGSGTSPAVSFNLSRAEPVDVALCALSGRMVSTLLSGRLEAGPHTVRLDRTRCGGAGTYIVRLKKGSIASAGMVIIE